MSFTNDKEHLESKMSRFSSKLLSFRDSYVLYVKHGLCVYTVYSVCEGQTAQLPHTLQTNDSH